MIGDVNGILALPISDYEQRHVSLLNRSQDRLRAMSSFGSKSGVSYSDGIFSMRGGDAESFGILVFVVTSKLSNRPK